MSNPVEDALRDQNIRDRFASDLFAAIRVLQAALENIAEHIEVCPKCSGIGFAPHSDTDACRNCGGYGEVCEATKEVLEIRSALAATKRFSLGVMLRALGKEK